MFKRALFQILYSPETGETGSGGDSDKGSDDKGSDESKGSDATGGGDSAGDDDDSDDDDAGGDNVSRAELEAERKRRAAAEKRAEKLEAAEKKRADDGLSELEKERKRADEEKAARLALEKRLVDEQRRSAVRDAAARAGESHTEAVLRLVNLEDVTISDDGEVIGATAEIERLKREFPELSLFRSRRTSAPDTGQGKTSDRDTAPDEPETDEDVGAAIAKAAAERRNSGRNNF